MSSVQKTTMPDWLKRTLRTFLQAFVGSILAASAAGQWSETVPNWDALKVAAIAATVAAVIAAVTAVQNLLEDSTGATALK